MISKAILAVTTVGEAGVAVGSATTEEIIRGRVLAVKLNYHASAPAATTDVTLRQVNEQVTANIVNRPNSVTDVTLYPRVGVTDVAGAALTYDGTRPVVEPFPVCDKLILAVDECDALTNAVIAEIYYDEGW